MSCDKVVLRNGLQQGTMTSYKVVLGIDLP